MLTVVVPDEALRTALGTEPDVAAGRARLVTWDLAGDPPPGLDPAEVDVVVAPNSGMTPERFAPLHGMDGLRVVQLASAGYEHALGLVPDRVTLCNGRGVHDAGTAELAVGLLLAVQRGVVDAVRAMPEGRWEPRRRSSLADRRVMILGYGSIGSAVERRLAPFEVDVVRVASTRREHDGLVVHGVDELPALLPRVDAVVTVLPLTPSTEHLVDAAFLRALPDGAVVVNVGRGRVVDTEALLAETSSGRLRAALDVTDPEPLPPDHPLWSVPGVVVTPHLGGNTDATGPRLARLVARQVARLVAGEEPVNVVREPLT
ncbi:2-hydroxyacid dehydrogenase [Cellulomonas carbonis]|uniref:Dihydrofolate reductase n=1 Tax=Cellulomonas carbonis T26 TaxID=947969 RepID=A0A0A0BRX3_9CELL|nr:2-hydroxyacid dehydrogenase [Cellulomonas carbonis]KGM11198.1 dihydrofolate reductase [Cellulomonas carbonis T26]GGC12328.1 dehydrogenase [Cellulomonas carbonis]